MHSRSNDFRVLAEGLRFPEGPVALPDGSVLLVEIARGTLTRVDSRGRIEVMARVGGGPNGAALGPDGACYVCNNGGERFEEKNGVLLPFGRSDDYSGGRIERVDLDTGRVETVTTQAGDRGLSAPNDIVFDAGGGSWFTDTGQSGPEAQDHGAICYARAGGSAAELVVYPVLTPNGIGLSPDGSVLYVAETLTARLLAFDIIAPGKLDVGMEFLPGRLVGAAPGRAFFDSLAVEENGNICVAAPFLGQIVVISPGGGIVESAPVPDPLPTNICFGGPELRTAYITLAGAGKLIAMDWPRPGLRLHFSR